ncbi:hypothetical protein TVNIR_2085 [Thioalkalivibrio nitratireducens DSM 14787]|uniref:Uncharacterized protein n=1 Tax=Thioalkalivibrio nitratireducens (strain DSM 14787 / UNIQEM 213 / ALEN2) TaxID=1255043 RepID=L0DXP9_THIND|nr:hypothetical protein [Thioalkalivibrio nitratireducens]AGA33745.1 hypothetical protein TVNIR_2085 [Thioalkalivibrio nitratireducens DSM 14787]
MPALTLDQWGTARAEYEMGMSLNAVAARHDVSRSAVQKRAKRERWQQATAGTIYRAVADRVARVPAEATPEKRAAALDEEAGRRAVIIDRHRDELEAARVMARAAKESHQNVGDQIPADIKDPMERQQLLLAMKRAAFEGLKAAKIHVETLKLIQDGERKAWGLDMPVDLSSMTDEQLAALAAGRLPV